MCNVRSKTLACLVLLIGTAVAADAQEKRGRERKPGGREKATTAEIEVWAIRATTKNNTIDPELRSIADKLKSLGRFTGFKLEGRRRGTSALNRPFSAALIGGYSARVSPQQFEGGRVKLQVQITRSGQDRPVVDTVVTLPAGQFQLWAMPLDAGDQLIAAVAARTAGAAD